PPRGTTWVWRLEPALPFFFSTQIRPAMAAINPGPNRTMNYGGSIPEIDTSARVNMEDCLWPTWKSRRDRTGPTWSPARSNYATRTEMSCQLRKDPCSVAAGHPRQSRSVTAPTQGSVSRLQQRQCPIRRRRTERRVPRRARGELTNQLDI